MKIQFTLPTNEQFYNRYAGLIPTLNKLGYLAQVISALTEIGILYALIHSSVKDFLPELAAPIGMAGAILGTAFLEVGLRKFAPFGIRAIIFKRWGREDLPISIIVLATAAGLLFASGYLSFNGSKSIVEAVAPQPDQRNTAVYSNEREQAEREAREQYRNDVQATQGRHGAKIEATADLYAGLIAVEQQNLQRYEAREKATGKSYRTAKGRVRKRIAELEAEKARKVAAIREQEANDLAALQSARNDALTTAAARYAQAEQEVKQYNREQVREARAKVDKYGGGLAYFTVFCLIVFVLSVSINELHRKGAGIAEKPLPSQYDFSQGVFAEALTAINNRMQYKARTLISNFDMKTPPPPAPTPPPSLYDLAELTQPRVAMKFEQGEQQEVILPIHYANVTQQQRNSNAIQSNDQPPVNADIEQQAIEYTRAALELFRAGLEQQAKEMELRADDVINAYLGPGSTPAAIAEMRRRIVAYINGEGENPFSAHHRHNIGFKVGNTNDLENGQQEQQEAEKQESKAASNKATSNSASMEPGQCLQCGKTYSPRVSWQKYCSKQCRDEYHAAKNGGRVFDPKLYNKLKK